jgi:hydrogenase maturation factor HypF (carbamoyltransferase family)
LSDFKSWGGECLATDRKLVKRSGVEGMQMRTLVGKDAATAQSGIDWFGAVGRRGLELSMQGVKRPTDVMFEALAKLSHIGE